MNDILLSPIRLTELELLIENSLRKILNDFHPEKKHDNNKPLRLKEAADFIGVAQTSLYGIVHQGKIKPLKPGKHLLFTKESLENYLNGERPEQGEKPDPSTYLIKSKKPQR